MNYRHPEHPEILRILRILIQTISAFPDPPTNADVLSVIITNPKPHTRKPQREV